MKKSIGLLLLMMMSISVLTASNEIVIETPSNKVEFFSGSFEHAKMKAGNEGKLFFVEFYADWCTPCKWMDKTTFKNISVIDQLNHNYVPLKMDIESKEGQNLQDQYDVKILPTIFIFDSQGRMIERIEKTLSSESMITLLNFHNNPENRVVVNHSFNVSPANKSTLRGPGLDNLYAQYQMSERFRTNYKLQMGFYYDYTKAYKKVKELQEDFIEPIIVLNDYVENTTQFKVLMGEFKTIKEAEDYRKILKNDFDIDAIIY